MLKLKEIAARVMDIIKDDDAFEAKFDRDPAKAIEEVLGVDLPDKQVNAIVKAVKSKLDLDELDDFIEDKLPGLSELGKFFD